MFGFKKRNAEHELEAPAKGNVVALADTKDPVFSKGIMGKGFGLEPTEGTIYAPISGKVTVVADTKHAVGIQTPNGLEVLLHLGIDTVELKGAGFDMNVKVGQKVKAKDKVGTMDLQKIKDKDYQTTILTVITNLSDKDVDLDLTTGKSEAGQPVAEIKQN